MPEFYPRQALNQSALFQHLQGSPFRDIPLVPRNGNLLSRTVIDRHIMFGTGNDPPAGLLKFFFNFEFCHRFLLDII